MGGSFDAANNISAKEAMAKTKAWVLLILPAGIERILVRGLRASIEASISLFKDIAAALAPAKASITYSQVVTGGK